MKKMLKIFVCMMSIFLLVACQKDVQVNVVHTQTEETQATVNSSETSIESEQKDEHAKEEAEEAHFYYAAVYPLTAGKTYALRTGHTHKHSLVFSFEKNFENLEEEKAHELFEEAVNRGETEIEDQSHFSLELQKAYRLHLAHFDGVITFTVSETGNYTFLASHAPEDALFYAMYETNPDVEIDPLQELHHE